tara:strand:+ start:3217 stop:4173 length:957 start_codon:yes stop_codon:yes gene_type:complete
MNSIFKDIDLSDCVDIKIIKRGERTIEFIGEIHNKPLPSPNSYVKMLDIIKRKNPDILVEHSDVLCNLDNLDPHKIDFMLSYGGSETIFLNLISNDYSKIECADNRLRMGMLSRSQIHQFQTILIDILESSRAGLTPDILNILPFLLGGLKVVKSDDIRELFSNSSYKKLYPIFQGALGEQAKLILTMVKNSRTNSMFFKENIISEMTNGEIFINIFLTMIRNLEIFASMVFDINVINKILISRSKRMIVYAGINHINRIAALLTNNDDVSMLDANMRAPFTLVDNRVTSGISIRDSLPLPMDILPHELLEEYLSRLS